MKIPTYIYYVGVRWLYKRRGWRIPSWARRGPQNDPTVAKIIKLLCCILSEDSSSNSDTELSGERLTRCVICRKKKRRMVGLENESEELKRLVRIYSGIEENSLRLVLFLEFTFQTLYPSIY